MSEFTITRTETGKKRATEKATVKMEYTFEKNTYQTLLVATKYKVKYFKNNVEIIEKEFLDSIKQEKNCR